MNLVNVAKVVAVLRIPSLPEKELHAGLRALVEAEVELPSETKRALVQREVFHLTQKVLEGSEEALLAMLHVCRPWRNSTDDDTFDPLKPKVVDLDGSVLEVLAVATKYMVKNILMELLLQGEEKSALVATVCRVSHKVFTESLEAEVDEVIESWICELTTLWSAFYGLLTPSVVDAAVENDIKAIRDSKKSDKSVLSIGKDILMSSEFYKEKLKTWELFAPDLKSSGKSLGKITTLLKNQVPDMVSESLDAYREALHNLQIVKLKTRPNCCDQVEGDMEQVLSLYANGITDQSGMDLMTVKSLESLMAEACKAFPASLLFKKAGERVKTSLGRVDEQARMAWVSEAIVTWGKQLKDPENDGTIKNDIKEIANKLSSCDGLELDMTDLRDPFEIICDKAIACLLAETCMVEARTIVGQIERFRRFTVKEDKFVVFAADLSVMHKVLDAEVATAAFILLGCDDTARLIADKNLSQTKTFMSLQRILETADLGACSQDVKLRVDCVLVRMRKLEADFGDQVLNADEIQFQSSLAALEDIAGGSVGGKLWHDQCSDHDDWDLLFDTAKATICKLDGRHLDSQIVQLTKVLSHDTLSIEC
jgi:hypothetical protein